MDMELGRIQFASGPSQWAHAANVGYGLSYALPILIALLKAPDTATLIVDSPEAHLHPRAQSKMGALLAYFANSGLRLVVETHSDHVLSGVRIAVKNAIIEPEDASIYFFEEGNSGGPRQILVDKNGSIDYWPEGFFDQSLADLVELS